MSDGRTPFTCLQQTLIEMKVGTDTQELKIEDEAPPQSDKFGKV